MTNPTPPPPLNSKYFFLIQYNILSHHSTSLQNLPPSLLLHADKSHLMSFTNPSDLFH